MESVSCYPVKGRIKELTTENKLRAFTICAPPKKKKTIPGRCKFCPATSNLVANWPYFHARNVSNVPCDSPRMLIRGMFACITEKVLHHIC